MVNQCRLFELMFIVLYIVAGFNLVRLFPVALESMGWQRLFACLVLALSALALGMCIEEVSGLV